MKRRTLIAWVPWFTLMVACQAPAADRGYNPLATSGHIEPESLELAVVDGTRNREIPIRIVLPATRAPAPIILFSPGLGGSRQGYPYLGRHWASRGYTTVYIQHPGSDDSVWRNKPLGKRMEALKRAASLENFMLRVKDIPAVLNQLAAWNGSDRHPLARRLDLNHVGMAGHSFGAVTTQAVSGEQFARRGALFTDPRIDAALAMSPSSPQFGSPKTAFGKVRIPWMLVTGTQDVAPIGHADLQSRLSVFTALPPGGKYELVLYGAEHSAFGDRALPGDQMTHNPNHHRVILALSTAFWDAWLRRDVAAQAWLAGDEPRTLLERGDRWQVK